MRGRVRYTSILSPGLNERRYDNFKTKEDATQRKNVFNQYSIIHDKEADNKMKVRSGMKIGLHYFLAMDYTISWTKGHYNLQTY